MTERKYKSIFLGSENPQFRYFGWQMQEDEPGLRVLCKRYGPFSRTLLLLGAAGLEALPKALLKLTNRSHWADLVVHDFDGSLNQPVVLNGLCFQMASATERLLNIATFVIDLTRDDTDLQAAMCTDYRRKVRKAEASGLKVQVYEKPKSRLVDKFHSAYSCMAAERGLAVVRREVLYRMYEDGHALLLIGLRGGEPCNFLHVYTSSETGFFMYGVNPKKENDGAGQFIHWRAIQELRSRGLTWYDLGGVPAVDPSNGIYQFKEKFGGQFVSLGREWRHLGRALWPLNAALRLVRHVRSARVFW